MIRLYTKYVAFPWAVGWTGAKGAWTGRRGSRGPPADRTLTRSNRQAPRRMHHRSHYSGDGLLPWLQTSSMRGHRARRARRESRHRGAEPWETPTAAACRIVAAARAARFGHRRRCCCRQPWQRQWQPHLVVAPRDASGSHRDCVSRQARSSPARGVHAIDAACRSEPGRAAAVARARAALRGLPSRRAARPGAAAARKPSAPPMRPPLSSPPAPRELADGGTLRARLPRAAPPSPTDAPPAEGTVRAARRTPRGARCDERPQKYVHRAGNYGRRPPCLRPPMAAAWVHTTAPSPHRASPPLRTPPLLMMTRAPLLAWRPLLHAAFLRGRAAMLPAGREARSSPPPPLPPSHFGRRRSARHFVPTSSHRAEMRQRG